MSAEKTEKMWDREQKLKAKEEAKRPATLKEMLSQKRA